MRSIEEVTEDIGAADGTPPELLDELFWCCMVRGMASGVASWGKLFCDIRGWTKGGDAAPAEELRLTDEEAAALIKAVTGN